MRGPHRAGLSAAVIGSISRTVLAALAVAVVAFGIGACAGADDPRSPATVRAERRAFDGAPPVAPHDNFGMACVQCHNQRGIEVPDVGFAPPSPHEITEGMSATSRCVQCHVFQESTDVFVANSFVGIRQDLRSGRRLNDLAPPVMPHKLLMRENCAACHTGQSAREAIRTSHPERARCTQCHLPQVTTSVFRSDFEPGS